MFNGDIKELKLKIENDINQLYVNRRQPYINTNDFNGFSGDLANILHKVVYEIAIDVSKEVVKEAIDIFLERLYTSEHFEQDLGLR